jgi:sterol desaturase/sphingolipid hydroxylase (fatty acid hydroxylase superfamily)
MNMLIIFGIAAGCILAECLWPAMELPRVNAWWGRVILINSIQLESRCAGKYERFKQDPSFIEGPLHDWVSALIIYFSTFVYYWWHRFRHESPFYGACYIRFTTQPVALKSLRAFTNTRWKF